MIRTVKCIGCFFFSLFIYLLRHSLENNLFNAPDDCRDKANCLAYKMKNGGHHFFLLAHGGYKKQIFLKV